MMSGWTRRHMLARGAALLAGAAVPALLSTPVLASTTPSAGAELPDWAFLPNGWDDAASAAVRASATTQAWMTVVGDSVAQGLVSSDFLTTSWYARLRAAIRSVAPFYGDFYTPAESAGFVNVGGAEYAGAAPFIIFGNATFAPAGYGRVPFFKGPQPVALLAFLSPEPCAAMDILWGNQLPSPIAGSTWTYNVDGGPTQTVTVPPPSQVPFRISLTGLDPTKRHVVAVLSQSVEQACSIWGVATYSGETRGIGFAKFAAAGDMVAVWNTTISTPTDRYSVLRGKTATADTGMGFPAQPALAIIALGPNDCIAGTSLPDYQRGLTRMIEAFRTGYPNCSILLVASSDPVGSDKNVTQPRANAFFYTDYVFQMGVLARAYGCGMLDFQMKWGDSGVAQGFQTPTQPHPTDLGHQDMSNTILWAIAGTYKAARGVPAGLSRQQA